MSAKIEVEEIGSGDFKVRVSEGQTETTHRVTLKPADYERIASGNSTPAEVVRRSFEFLLENEPKESILPRFDLTVISRYFPAYEGEIRRRLAAS
jgi:hypothetical protein